MKRHIDYPLMWSIFEDLGEEIESATAGDQVRAAVLASLTANGSGGAAAACRFSPTLLDSLSRVLEGEESLDASVSKQALRIWLDTYSHLDDEKTLLRGAAGFHGFTLMAGIHAVRWGISLDELAASRDHFERANRLVDEYCIDHDLELPGQLVVLARLWTAGRGLRAGSVSMYAGRLMMRFEIYAEILGGGRMRRGEKRRE